MKTSVKILSLVVFSATGVFGQGTIIWDELVNGPLSNGGGSQTPLGHYQNGTNSILGATEFIPNGIYGDYFTFTVPTASEIPELWLSANKPVAVWLGTPDFGTEFGYIINPANGDLVSQWGLNSIGSGTYGMYIKNYDFNSGVSIADYRLDFFVQTIPEPATLWLLLGGLGWLSVRGLQAKCAPRPLRRK